MLEPDRYIDQDVFVVLGGPSLVGYPWECLAERQVVAVNRAWEVLPHADLIVSLDNRYYESQRNLESFQQHPATKCWLDRVGWHYAEDVERVKVAEGLGLNGPKIDLRKGISHGENSGFAAMCLALACGARCVHLLGLDLISGGKWWHSGYRRGWGPTNATLAIYRAFWEWAAATPAIAERVEGF